MLTYSILHPKTKSKQNHPGIRPYSDRCRGVPFYLTILLRSALSAVSACLPSFWHLGSWTANPDVRKCWLWWKYRCDPATLESASSVHPLSAIGWHRSGASLSLIHIWAAIITVNTAIGANNNLSINNLICTSRTLWRTPVSYTHLIK